MSKSSLERLKDLTTLTEATKQASQGRLALLASEAEALRGQLARIEAERKATLAAIDPASPAGRANSALSWEIWIDRRKRDLNMELARVLARKDSARRELRISFGRDGAAHEMYARLTETARRDAQRKADDGG